jgi:hypothetical protein
LSEIIIKNKGIENMNHTEEFIKNQTILKTEPKSLMERIFGYRKIKE